ncbi:MAG: methyl-accepting chemotaxis protein [Oscillospiraceae bacterium]|nr:methyl-accepting chemotaxis protein [Oscillospiraceae bacterium]
MKFKKLSWKIAVIVVTTVAIISLSLVTYYQIRVVALLNRYSEENLNNELSTKIGDYNLPFTDSMYIVKSLRNYAEASFEPALFRSGAEDYFENEFRPLMEPFVINTVLRSYFIDGAYFSVDYRMSGSDYIGEVFIVCDGEGGYEIEEPYDIEDYAPDSGTDMDWFFGAFNSGRPNWTPPYMETDGEYYVSFAEPVVIGGQTIGVVGIDISIAMIKELVSQYKVFDSGFAIIKCQTEFFDTNDFITRLSPSERQKLINAANTVKNGETFTVTLNSTAYVAMSGTLINDYEVFILVPKSEYDREAFLSTLRMVILFPIVFALAFVICFFIGKRISKPIVIVSEHLETIASGDYTAELPQDVLNIRDETGNLARVSHNLRLRLAYLTDRVKTISECNLTETVELSFNGDIAGIALNDTIDTLNDMFTKLNIMAQEFRSESANLADGSNMLSDGCTEQAKAVDELMEIMGNIVASNKDNVAMLEEALRIESTVKNDARAGDSNMQQLSETVREINEASRGIHKILKAIEDIAFQTNILALNAAVEAARAGAHGKGFAVVAEEVRNLAAKSAEAAKETAHLVGVSTQKAEAGEELAIVTAQSLSKIIDGINKTEEIIKKIEINSHKNDEDITLMNKDLNIVSDITQRTASTAEQTAAMSEEMNGQAASLKEIVNVFRIK